MAKLIKAGPFVGSGEERAAAFLEAGLPDGWFVISNKELVSPDGSAREVDFIIIGKHAVFVVDEKSWRGAIHGNTTGWVLRTGESYTNPLGKAEHVARRLAGLLRKSVPKLVNELQNRPFVFARVLLSADEVQLFVQDPRVRSQVIKLAEAVDHLREVDQQHGKTLSIGSFREQFVKILTELPNRPAIPRSVGDYEVLELLDAIGLARKLRAQHADGSPRFLKLLRRPDTAIKHAVQEIENAILREYEALKLLSGKNVAPLVDPYFSWEEGNYWVIPIHPIDADSLRAHRSSSAPSRTEILPVVFAAFQSLARVHDADVLHRGLSPDRIFLTATGAETQVVFSDFTIARLKDAATVADIADEIELDPETQYRAPECKLSLELADQTSDVYGLAASLLYWITEYEVGQDADIKIPRLAQLRSDILSADAALLEPLFESCLLEDDQRRPSAKAVVERIEQELVCRKKQTRRIQAEAVLFEPGQTIEDQYEVIRLLGQGATADTYLVRDLAAQDFRVLKRIRNLEYYSQLSSAEFGALSKLYHPNLPRVFDVRLAAAPFHLKIEYVPGSPLTQIGENYRGDTGVCLRIGRDILSALAFLAGKGFVHRDVSPANILLPDDADEPVRLIDFGLATSQPDCSGLFGTPSYRAPEVEQGGTWSPRCDLYSVGVILFELLTGRLPYEREGDRRHKDRVVAPTPDESDRCGIRFLRTLLKAVAPSPSDRFSDAKEFLAELENAFSQGEEDISDGIEGENPFVDELRRTYRNSRIGNTNNRGLDSSFSRDTYVETRLDTELLPKILRGDFRLVVLSGNPGDGKTAYLQRLRHCLGELKATVERENDAGWRVQVDDRSFAALYDASESHEGASADDLFHELLAPLASRREPGFGYTACVAVNDGRLRDFFERNGVLKYRWIWDRLRPQIEGWPVEPEGVLLLDMKHRCLAVGGPNDGSLFTGILRHFTAPDRWESCTGCVARRQCTIWWNVQSLQHDTLSAAIVRRLQQLLLAVHLRRERRPTIRDLRSALAFIITHDLGCADIHRERSQGQSPLAQLSRLYFNSIFNGAGTPDLLLDEFLQLDPALVPSPRLDRFFHFHRIQDQAAFVESLFQDLPERSAGAFDRLDDRSRITVLKRRYAFECCSDAEIERRRLPGPEALLPYRYLRRFHAALSGAEDVRQLRDDLLVGISRADGVPSLSRLAGLALRLTEASSETLVVIKLFPSHDFELFTPSVPEDCIESLTDQLVLKHRSGAPQLQIGLDLFEFLCRACEGCVAGSEEQRALVEDLGIFKNQLLTHPTLEVLVIEAGHRIHRVSVCEGRIIREEAET